MNSLTLTALLAVGAVGAEPSDQSPIPTTYQMLPISGYADPAQPPVAQPAYSASGAQPALCDQCAAPVRGLFQSDREFEGFVGPISNPVLSKDPRSNTHARVLFVNNNIPASHPLGGGNIQVYGLQLNLALTERLSFIADKDGIGRLAPRNAASQTGFLNIAAGLKYTFYRNVETQTLAAVGFM